MCGIGGFSLSKNSRISPRSLSNALLTELDNRGNQASGFAYQSKTESGVFKKDVAGARLNLKRMPKNAKDVILHTRYATHGTIKDMANNHPIQSPDKTINLVHNGVIYNHTVVRKSLDAKLPEVDTSVIPAILQQFNRDTDKFSMLEGDAAVAWLDDSNRGKLRLARISHSPLVICQLKDGSFVFASTEAILRKALNSLGLEIDFIAQVAERKLLTVKNGRLDEMTDLPEMDMAFADTTSWNYASYRDMTSGGHGQTAKQEPTTPIKSIWGDIAVPNSWFSNPNQDDFYPPIEGLFVNEYGEYFDENNVFIGDIDDMVDWGFVDYDGNILGSYNSSFNLATGYEWDTAY